MCDLAFAAGRIVTVIDVAPRSASPVVPDPDAVPADEVSVTGARGCSGGVEAEARGGCRLSSPIASAKAVATLTARNPDDLAASTSADGRLSAPSPRRLRPMPVRFRRWSFHWEGGADQKSLPLESPRDAVPTA